MRVAKWQSSNSFTVPESRNRDRGPLPPRPPSRHRRIHPDRHFVPGIPSSPPIGGGVPLTTFSSYTVLGSPDFLPKRQIPVQYQGNHTLRLVHGRQSVKFGVSLYAPMRNIFQDEGGTRGGSLLTRNTLRGPRTSVLDASRLREFSIGKKANLEFRREVFTVMNTPLFVQPAGDFSSATAGNITTLSGDPRVMQLALRLSF